jgi:hypothetical protein
LKEGGENDGQVVVSFRIPQARQVRVLPALQQGDVVKIAAFQLENQHTLELDLGDQMGFLIRDDQGQAEAMWYMPAKEVVRLAEALVGHYSN